jgi:hypothetical protein
VLSLLLSLLGTKIQPLGKTETRRSQIC